MKTNDLLSYEWFIDNKPLESTTDTIEYEDISYLMNDGMLKCKASNTIGSNTDQIRLNVQCKFYSSWTKCLKTLSVVNIGEAVCTRFFNSFGKIGYFIDVILLTNEKIPVVF